VNSRKLLNEILDKEGIKEKEKVMKELDKLDKLSEKEVLENLKKYNAENMIGILKNKDSFFEKYESYNEILELRKYCAIYNVNINFQPNLARGLSYYNGCVFEVKTMKMKETIIAGGSYPVNDIQSTGVSFGIERLAQLAQINLEEKRILIISIGEDEKTVKFAEELRKNQISCLIMYGKISKALEFANSYNIPYVIFIGEEEIKKKKLKLRDMKTGIEKLMDEKEIIGKLK
jgi:histidyl-tRNA synthetase